MRTFTVRLGRAFEPVRGFSVSFSLSSFAWTMASKLSIADIDCKIAYIKSTLLLYPRPNSLYIISVHMLAIFRLRRFELSQQKADLDKCIVHCTEAIFLPPVSWAGFSLNVVGLLFHLASALLRRAKMFEQPRDTKYSIVYLRYLRGLPLDYFDLPKNVVTTSLIQALVIESEAYDGAQSIDEMMVLCRELLASDLSAGFPVVTFASLVDAVNAEFLQGRSVHLLDEVIECLRDAVKMGPPSSHLLLFALANALCIRILETHSNDDYEEATALLERVLHHNQSGECPDHSGSSFIICCCVRICQIDLLPEPRIFRSVNFPSPYLTQHFFH
ncbi:hypothetical protein EDB89DRAFT_215867 [Lactarius sanguifluus]|nr:hypothetical protein EDB89DRAFT_215867 [Lactarius sanguifluus]